MLEAPSVQVDAKAASMTDPIAVSKAQGFVVRYGVIVSEITIV